MYQRDSLGDSRFSGSFEEQNKADSGATKTLLQGSVSRTKNSAGGFFVMLDVTRTQSAEFSAAFRPEKFTSVFSESSSFVTE